VPTSISLYRFFWPFNRNAARDSGFARLVKFSQPLGHTDHPLPRVGHGRLQAPLAPRGTQQEGLARASPDTARVPRAGVRNAAQGGRWDPAEAPGADPHVAKAARGGRPGRPPGPPATGRPPSALSARIRKIIGKTSLSPVMPERAQSMIADRAGVACHIAIVRRPVHITGLPHRVARLARVNQAGRLAILAWQRDTRKRLASLRRRRPARWHACKVAHPQRQLLAIQKGQKASKDFCSGVKESSTNLCSSVWLCSTARRHSQHIYRIKYCNQAHRY